MARTLYLKLTMRFWQEENQWVGKCEELGTAVCGDSMEEAQEALDEAVAMNLEGLAESGELCRFIEEYTQGAISYATLHALAMTGEGGKV